MGILDIFRPRRAGAALVAPAPTSTSAGIVSPWQDADTMLGQALWSDLLGAEAVDAVPPTRAEAMSLPVLAKVRRAVCTRPASLPLVTYRGRDVVPQSPKWVDLNRPERNRAPFITYTWTFDAMHHYGRAWWVVTERYADGGRPAWFEWVPEWRGIFNTDGDLIGHSDGRRFEARDVVRIDGPDEGLLNHGRRPIRAALRLEAAYARAAGNPVPALDLHQTSGPAMIATEVDEMIDRWVRARNAGRAVSFTPPNIEAKPLVMDAGNLLIEGRKAADLALVRQAGAPAWVADVPVEGSALTYSNVPSRSREFVDFGAGPLMDALCSRLSMPDILPNGMRVEHDTSRLLRGDFTERVTGYKIARESEVYTKDELRDLESLPPLADSEDAAR